MSDIILAMAILAILFAWIFTAHEKDKTIETERQQWHIERQQLLDRIQAPSFDHLKQAEVRLERVRQTKEPSKDNVLELL